MVNYYKILKVSPKASNAEIKSAYRRLARKLHPDKNNGSEEAAREFAKIAKAYEILGNPQQRAAYDQKMLRAQYSASQNTNSVFHSDNPHARRWRQMAYERRYNEIIDRMIADERRESAALQKVIFPTVALFLSTCFVAIFKPVFWNPMQATIGNIVLFSLFVAGVLHLVSRFRFGLEQYTSGSENIHDSILEKSEPKAKPYTRFAAVSFLLIGFCLSLGIGLLIGHYFEPIVTKNSHLFSKSLRLDLVFYPPIAVLFVDVIHAFIWRNDG